MGDGDGGVGDGSAGTAGDTAGDASAGGVGDGNGDGGYGGYATGAWDIPIGVGNWGDYSIGGLDDLYQYGGEDREKYLRSLGYTGDYGGYALGGRGFQGGVEGGYNYGGNLSKWFGDQQANGMHFKQMYDGERSNTFHLQGFDKNNNKVGMEQTYQPDKDTEFGWVLAGLAAAGGGLAGAGLAAGAGYGAGTAVGGAAAGAGAGLGSSLAQSGDISTGLKGAAIGGVTGGLTQGVNPAQLTGVTDPMYSRAINGAFGAGTRAAIGGGNIGSAIGGSLLNSGLSAGGNYALGEISNMGDTSYDQAEANRFSNYPAPQEEQGGYSTAPWAQQSTMDRLTGQPAPEQNFSTAPGFNADNPNATSVSQYMGAGSSPSTQRASADNPVKQMIMSSARSLQAPGRMDNMASNLMDLYNRYRTNKDQGGLAGDLRSMYAPNSPYAQRMQQVLERADAKAGRRSQIGPRQVELQARMAEANQRIAPTLNQIYQQQGANRMGMGSDLFRMLSNDRNGGGGFGMLSSAGNTLSNYFNPQPPPIDYSGTNDMGGF